LFKNEKNNPEGRIWPDFKDLGANPEGRIWM